MIELQKGQLKNKGVRAVQQALRLEGLRAQRDLVNEVMRETDPKG